MTRTRQLAAIMFTDIVGFTGLMGSDEKLTFDILQKNRQLHKPIINEYHGKWIKELGDGVMATFSTVSDAVNAAIKIMETCNAAGEYQLCIGIHSAEVVFEDGDVFGDGVNIAARIQAAAEPGSILVSESVYRNISNRTEIRTHFVKEERLKNVSEPVKLYQVLSEGSSPIRSESNLTDQDKSGFHNKNNLLQRSKFPALLLLTLVLAYLGYTQFFRDPNLKVNAVSLQDSSNLVKNSIAVLPFVNMSNDPEQEYFSDGISEEIINLLAQVPELKVTGRTSSFAFKGKNMDLKLIGDQLNARYLLEGSVRKGNNKLRITAQLIEAANGYHLYSEKFDREIVDVFAIQDEISMAILDAIKMKILSKDREALLKRYTENVEAYQLYLKGRFHMNRMMPEGLLKAIEFYDAAINLDADYAIAYADKAFCLMVLVDQFGWPKEENMAKATRSAGYAFELDPDIIESNLAIGRIKLHWDWKIEEAKKYFEKALSINSNSVQAHIQLGFCYALLEQMDSAVFHANIAIELDPLSVLDLWQATVIHMYAGDYETTARNGQKMIEMAPNFFAGYSLLGYAKWAAGNNIEETILNLEKMVTLAPSPFTMSNLGLAYAHSGDPEKAREILNKLEEIKGVDKYYGMASIFVALGEWDKAYQYYELAINNREVQILYIKLYLNFSPAFLKEARTKELLQRIGLPS